MGILWVFLCVNFQDLCLCKINDKHEVGCYVAQKVYFADVPMISCQKKMTQDVGIINASVSPKYLSFNSFLCSYCPPVPFLPSALACQISRVQQ